MFFVCVAKHGKLTLVFIPYNTAETQIKILSLLVYEAKRIFVRPQHVALIYLHTVLVIESGKLADGIGVNLITRISIQHTFLLPILNDVRIIILFIEISVCPFFTINSTRFEFDCSFHC